MEGFFFYTAQRFYPPNWESTCTFEIGKTAHAKGMSSSVDDAKGGGEYERGVSIPLVGGGVWGASPRNFFKI